MQFVRWNRRLTAVTGYGDEEIAEMVLLDLIADEDRETAVRDIAEIFASGQATAEFDIGTRGGERIPYSWTGSLIRDEDGNPRYVCGIGHDMTPVTASRPASGGNATSSSRSSKPAPSA